MSSKQHITLRIPRITDMQISDLSLQWGENKSQAIIRSIDRTWVREIKSIILDSDFKKEKEGDRTLYTPQPTFKDIRSTLYTGDAKNVLTRLPAKSVDCVVTSPPYYGQRDYEVKGQIGLEDHPELYIINLISVFREVYRVLKPTGSLWVNIGDTYWSGKGRSHGVDDKQKHRRFNRPQDKSGIKPWGIPKQLQLLPHRFAIAMQDEGWSVRGDNVWYKPNPTPDPVEDRCARAHEYMFHFVKQRYYWFDSDAVAIPSNGRTSKQPPHSVWAIKTDSAQKEHKAVFPDELVTLPLQATLPSNGTLLDPFCGSGTALAQALKLSNESHVIGIDISEQSVREAQAIIKKVPG